MNPYMNEDVMWQRLKDIQREAENARRLGLPPGPLQLVRLLGRRAWWLAGLAARRPPRRHPVIEREQIRTRSDVA